MRRSRWSWCFKKAANGTEQVAASSDQHAELPGRDPGSELAKSSARRSPVGGAAQSVAWRPLPVRVPVTEPSKSPTRGPVWLVTLLDFVERATGRTTSLREHMIMFVVYVLMIALLPIGIAAVVVVKIVAMGSWSGMISIGIVAASAGGAVFLKRLRRDSELPAAVASTGDLSASEATSAEGDATELVGMPPSGSDTAGQAP
jgi:hypothetical protein